MRLRATKRKGDGAGLAPILRRRLERSISSPCGGGVATLPDEVRNDNLTGRAAGHTKLC